MQIEQRSVGDVVVLSLVGRFIRGVGDRSFHGAIDELFEGVPTKVLRDLSQVPFIDSSGIGELVAAKRRADDQGISLKLIRIEERVAKTLRLGMILPLFETFSSEDEALASFADSGDS
jgi:anti-sigma B factor antagonist